MEMITPGLHRIGLGIVNAYLLETPEALVLVDTGFPGSEGRILDAMRQLGYAPDRLGHIVATHAHPDHVGSLAALAGTTGAQTWMHVLDAPLAERADMRPVHPAPGLLPKLLYGVMQVLPKKGEPARINHKIDGEMTLPFGGLQVLHAPGHCLGQIVLHWPSRDVLIAADSCMNLRRLRLPLVNENLDLAAESLRRISEVDFAIACFGHGQPIRTAAAAAFRNVATPAKV